MQDDSILYLALFFFKDNNNILRMILHRFVCVRIRGKWESPFHGSMRPKETFPMPAILATII